ncbi:MAG: 30S ribosomal protein S4 [Candidatus Peregrinibacteria bacterium]
MRYTGPRNRLARREGQDLFLKSSSVDTSRPLGFAGSLKKGGKLSEYGQQLREKQKAKRIFGVTEKTFRNYYKKASQKRGAATGFTLLSFLETRLDNVVYRSGFALTRAQARQMVNHGVFLINGAKVDIPSYQVKTGDKITVRERSLDHPVFREMSDQKTFPPKWLSVDLKGRNISVMRSLEEDEAEPAIQIQSIIEFYSR